MNQAFDDSRAQGAAFALRAVAETLALTIAIPALGWLLRHDDPFALRASFPWPLFAPVLSSLLYGSALGITSAALLDAGILAWHFRAASDLHLPVQALIGFAALGMVCGLFSDVFLREIRKLRASDALAREQAKEVGAAYALLELSHARLAALRSQSVPSLQDAVDALCPLQALTELEPLCQPLLELLANYFYVELASVYAVSAGRCADLPLSSLGQPKPVTNDDPLVSFALHAQCLARVQANDASSGSPQTQLLLVIPFREDGTTRLLVCVEAMAFFAFETQNLEVLASLGESLISLLRRAPARAEHS
jgi:hypothetical protein